MMSRPGRFGPHVFQSAFGDSDSNVLWNNVSAKLNKHDELIVFLIILLLPPPRSLSVSIFSEYLTRWLHSKYTNINSYY